MTMRHLTVLALAALFALPACKDEVAGAEPDNTARNERDREGNNPTPLDQKNNENDLRIAQEIRKALVDNDQLSLNAHNVKVISVNGLVTLRGPVQSNAERDTVEVIATAVAGVTRVDNQLEVDVP
jgi:hyperosmotically inducible periplasmic protein